MPDTSGSGATESCEVQTESGTSPPRRKSEEMKYLLALKAKPEAVVKGAAEAGGLAFPRAAVVAGIVASVTLSLIVKDNIESEAQLRFERQASDAEHVIEARVKSYVDVLYGLGALFSTSSAISRAEFRRYVAGL